MSINTGLSNACEYYVHFVMCKICTKQRKITKKCLACNLAENDRLTPSYAAIFLRRAAAISRDPLRNAIRPFSFFQEGNLILLFARQNSRVAVQDVPIPLLFFYSRCFPRSIRCVKTIGWKISESFGLPSQAGIENVYDAHIISSQGRRCKRENHKYTTG